MHSGSCPCRGDGRMTQKAALQDIVGEIDSSI